MPFASGPLPPGAAAPRYGPAAPGAAPAAPAAPVAPVAPSAARSTPSAATERQDRFTFAFHDADISQVSAEILGRALGLSYTVDPSVTGKISFEIDKKLTGAQLLEAFEVALEDSGVTLVREGDALAVKSRDKAKLSTTVRNLRDGIRPAGYQTLAVPVDFAAPSEVAKALQAVAGKDIVVFEDDKLGLLVLGGSQGELQSAVETVHLFDTSSFQDAKIRFIDLQQAAAPNLVADLNKLIDASKMSGVTAIPLKRLNAVFVVAQSPAASNKVAEWIRTLDVPSREKTLSLWVYHPRNLTAEALSGALGSVAGTQGGGSQSGGGQTPAPAATASGPQAAGSAVLGPQATSSMTGGAASAPSSGGGGGGSGAAGSAPATTVSSEDDPVRFGVDRQSNTLLISASPAHWIQIQRTLEELDRTPSQVLIEASILEVTLSNQFNTCLLYTSDAADE